ncbi:MAG: DUF3806 domain-containing protein [Phycisphaerales bacterium]
MADHTPEKTNPLTRDQRLLIAEQFGLIFEWAAAAGVDIEDESDEAPDTPDILDEILRWWHAQPQNDRPPRDDTVFALGIALGDFLRHVLDVEWCTVQDADGVEFALVNDKHGAQHLFWPVSTVHKRFDQSPDGLICDFLDNLFENERVLSLQRPEDDEPEPLLPDA